MSTVTTHKYANRVYSLVSSPRFYIVISLGGTLI